MGRGNGKRRCRLIGRTPLRFPWAEGRWFGRGRAALLGSDTGEQHPDTQAPSHCNCDEVTTHKGGNKYQTREERDRHAKLRRRRLALRVLEQGTLGIVFVHENYTSRYRQALARHRESSVWGQRPYRAARDRTKTSIILAMEKFHDKLEQ